MSKRCELTGKGVLAGNNVSHSQRKTRRRFLPNIQNVTLKSDALDKSMSFSIALSTLRTVDHNGGLDNFLLTTSNSKLTAEAVKLKRTIKKSLETKAAQ